jgi:hypothetical protein
MGRPLGLLALCFLLGCARAPTRTSDPPTPSPPDEETPAAEDPAPEPAAETTAPEEPDAGAASSATAPALPAEPARRPTGPKKRGRRGATARATEPAAAPPVTPPAAGPAAIDPPQSPTYSGPDPCQLAIRDESPVARACRKGGLKAAKATMKDLVRRAKAGGYKVTCDDCHETLDDFGELNSDAREKFKKLLEAAAAR